MLSVRKREMLSNGVTGINLIAVGVVCLLPVREWLTMIVMGIYFISLICVHLYIRHCKREPWDELARENHSKAIRLTLLFIELALLLYGMVDIIFKVSVTINTGTIFLLFGIIQLVQTLMFLYFDYRSASV